MFEKALFPFDPYKKDPQMLKKPLECLADQCRKVIIASKATLQSPPHKSIEKASFRLPKTKRC